MSHGKIKLVRRSEYQVCKVQILAVVVLVVEGIVAEVAAVSVVVEYLMRENHYLK